MSESTDPLDQPVGEPAAPVPVPADPAPSAVVPPWLQDLAAALSAPIPGADPAGENGVHEPDYEALDAEIKKPESVTDRRPVNWSTVESLALGILAQKSKDLKVAGFLAVASAQLRGARGLAAAAHTLADLVERFGDGVWPRRARGRYAALDWASEHLVALTEPLQPKRLDEEPLRFAAQRARAAREACRAALEEPGQEFQALATLHKWTELLERHLAEASKGGAATKAVEAPRPAAQAASNDGFSLESPEDAKRALLKLRALLGKCAEKLRGTDLADPAPYRAARQALWPDRLPFDVGKDGGTAIPMLEPTAAEKLLAAFADQAPADALRELEVLFPTRPWWLDLQRLVVQKLEALGESHAAAARAVAAETSALVRRLPVLGGCSFRTGVPFVGPATRAWLDTLQGGTRGPSEAGGDDPVAKVEADAREAVARGDLRGALGSYQRALATHAGRRAQFVLRLGLARTCLGGGQPTLALPHLQELRTDLGSLTLGAWAPDLAIEVLVATVAALRAAAKEKGAAPELKARAAEALAELSRLDPLAALELGT